MRPGARRGWLGLAFAVLVAAGACAGDAPDPCDGVAGTCLAVRVESSTVRELDLLELDVSYGDLHGTTTTQGEGGRVTRLPLATAIVLGEPATAIDVGVVAAGKLGGVVLGTGAAQTTLAPGAHGSIVIRLGPIAECVAGGHYCGGDKLAGAPDTVYLCNGGGVPIARGACAFGCIVRPTQDDVCRGGGGACVEDSFYCGGDKLDGDPQTLYRCQGGVGVDGVECPGGCAQIPGDDDACR